MAGDWIKMRVDLDSDPAVIRMAKILAVGELTIIGGLHKVWSWAGRQTVDGVVDGVETSWVNRYVYLPEFAEAMIEVGWLLLRPDRHGIEFPKFQKHNGEGAKKRILKSERQANWRERNEANSVDVFVDASVDVAASTREEKRREEIKSKAMSGNPDVNPLKEKNIEAKESAKRVLSFLNEKTGRAYRPVDANINMIVARIREGATEAQCRMVIAKKSREWSIDEKMTLYLRPATLFNATKFNQYVGELVNHGD